MPNIKNLIKVRDIIQTVEDVDQCNNPVGKLLFDYVFIWRTCDPECGTLGCVAGFTNHIFNHDDGGICEASATLGLTDFEQDWLFEPWLTDVLLVDNDDTEVYDDEISSTYLKQRTVHNKAEAIRRLNWLIDGKPAQEYIPAYVPDATHYRKGDHAS